MGPLDQPVHVSSQNEFVTVFGGVNEGLANPWLASSIAAYFANGGTRAWVVRVASADPAAIVGVDGGSEATRTGLQALRGIDEMVTVAAPGAIEVSVQQALISLCRQRGDCLAILDSASLDDVDAALAHRADLSAPSGFGALYFPWVFFDDLGTIRQIPPSGFVSAVYATTAIPKSPVGELALAVGLTRNVSDAEQAILNPEGVNVLRDFANNGVKVWGARTLATDSEMVFITVRRMASNLSEAILDGTQWAVFEANDETLWDALESVVDDFMHARFLDGWFQGTTPDDAYFVRVDSTTTSPADIAAGLTRMLVGFAAQRPGEFVILQLVIERPGTVFRDGFESPQVQSSDRTTIRH